MCQQFDKLYFIARNKLPAPSCETNPTSLLPIVNRGQHTSSMLRRMSILLLSSGLKHNRLLSLFIAGVIACFSFMAYVYFTQHLSTPATYSSSTSQTFNASLGFEKVLLLSLPSYFQLQYHLMLVERIDVTLWVSLFVFLEWTLQRCTMVIDFAKSSTFQDGEGKTLRRLRSLLVHKNWN